MILKISAESEDQTKAFAQLLASKFRGGELLQLKGDIGAGKTTFTSGLVSGLDSHDHVSSPTFTICNRYYGRLDVVHCDFYRLHNDELIENELAEILDSDKRAVVVLEWAEHIKGIKQDDVIEIVFTADGETSRELLLRIPQKYGYIAQ